MTREEIIEALQSIKDETSGHLDHEDESISEIAAAANNSAGMCLQVMSWLDEEHALLFEQALPERFRK